MACRDYEFDYEQWLDRGRRRLDEMAKMLQTLITEARRRRWELPSEAIEAERSLAGRERGTLSREAFDTAARGLCAMCRLAVSYSLPLSLDAAKWWERHQVSDRHDADLAEGLSPTPVYANFWDEHSARQEIHAEYPGVNHADAIRVFESIGFRILHAGKAVTLSNGQDSFLLPRRDPVNSFAMAALIRRVGLTDDDFRERLESLTGK